MLLVLLMMLVCVAYSRVWLLNKTVVVQLFYFICQHCLSNCFCLFAIYIARGMTGEKDERLTTRSSTADCQRCLGTCTCSTHSSTPCRIERLLLLLWMLIMETTTIMTRKKRNRSTSFISPSHTPLSLCLSHTHAHTLCFCLWHTYSLSLSYIISHCVCLSQTHTHTLPHSLSLILSHTWTHTHPDSYKNFGKTSLKHVWQCIAACSVWENRSYNVNLKLLQIFYTSVLFYIRFYILTVSQRRWLRHTQQKEICVWERESK